MSVCPLCNGDGERLVRRKLPNGLYKPFPDTEICLCRKAEFVAAESRMLDSIEGYLMLDEIDKQLKFVPDKLGKSPNYFITKTDFETFGINAKSILMHWRFTDPPRSMLCCNAIDILHRFYVQQSDGTSPTLAETEKYDLIIIILGTMQKNDQLKTCIAEVVQSRLKRKPTWIYMPDNLPSLEACKFEYSPELEDMVGKSRYEHISLTPRNVKTKNKSSVTASAAANFGGGA